MPSEGIEFTVYGAPVPQGSKRILHGNLIEMGGARLRSFRQDIHVGALQEMQGASPFVEPVEVRIMFSIPRPKSHYGTGRNASRRKEGLPVAPAKTPDIDKLGRAVLDGLTGAAFRDDAQVVGLTLSKLWADHSDAATTVSVVPLS
jgi:Holliday junction resolvase RusA-like endonuclease